MHQPGKELREPPSATVNRYSGAVVYIYSFDVAYEMSRQPVRELLGHPVAQFAVDADKRSPREFLFFRPQMVQLPAVERMGPHGTIQVERTVKLLPVGAITITIRVPFRDRTLEDLVVYHDLQFSGGNGMTRSAVARMCETSWRHCIRPGSLGRGSVGLAFRLRSSERAHRHPRNGTGSPPGDCRSVNPRAETTFVATGAEESTGKYLTYYERDLAVIDWDAALIVDARKTSTGALRDELANLNWPNWKP